MLCPRKSRHQCIFILLLFCFVGVYLTYRQLNEANKSPARASRLRHLPHIRKPESPQGHIVRQENKVVPAMAMIKPLDLDIKPVGNIGARNLENDDDYVTNEERVARLKALLIELSPNNWKTTPDADDIMLRVKSELMDIDVNSKYSCREIDALRLGGSYRQSYYGKKNVEHARVGGYGGKELVVKSIGSDHQFKIDCMKMDYNPDRCVLLTNYKIMRELMLLVTLDSSMLIKLEGFCLRGDTIDTKISKKGVVILTEPADQIESYTFSTFRWPDRLSMSIKVLQLLMYLENSPVGTLGLDKLHLSDFVLVDRKDIKLVDLDNIHVGEMGCILSADCKIPEMTRKEIPCVQNFCQGRNSLNNLLWVYRILLTNLLDLPPDAIRAEVSQMMSYIQELKLSTQQVLDKLQRWSDDLNGVHHGNKRAQQMPQKTLAPPPPDSDRFNNNFDNRASNDNQIDNNADWQSQNRGGNRPFVDQSDNIVKKVKSDTGYEADQGDTMVDNTKDTIRNNENNVPAVNDQDSQNQAKEPNSWHHKPGVYDRFPNSNFPAIMTMVRKNSARASVEHNYGATLFVKVKSVNERDEGPLLAVAKTAAPSTVSPVVSKQKQVVDMKVCLKKAANQTAPARSAREGRIFTHMGLRGITEDDWKIYALSTGIERHFGPSSLAVTDTDGSRFKIQYEKNSLGLKRGEFVLEQGPVRHHIGTMIVYYLDRVLGLYHTPPTIARKLTLSDMYTIKGDKSFVEKFSPFNSTVGASTFIKGLLTVAVPPVMRTEKLGIKAQKTIVTEVPTFTRSQKSHLEYVLLWSLSKLLQPQHGYLGYKGHLIHFETDLAFSNLQKSLLGYFYNCQFPNSVHKVLTCYKCPPDGQKMTKVCGLGEAVIARVQSSGFEESEVKVKALSSGDLSLIINNGASSILNIVEQCVHTFGRSKVLY